MSMERWGEGSEVGAGVIPVLVLLQVIDFPLSLVADTLVLPWTVTNAINASKDEDKGGVKEVEVEGDSE